MKNKLVYNLIGFLVFVFFCFCGCTRRSLEEVKPVSNVSINFNWKNLATDEELPSGMQLYFYSSEGLILTRDANASGFNGSLPAGTYQVLAYNTDAEHVQHEGLKSYESARVSAPVYTRASSYLRQPSHCYGVGLGTLTVLEADSSSATMVPRNFIRQAVIRVETGEYDDQIKSCSGNLSGFSSGAYLSSGDLVDDNGKLFFSTEKVSSSFSSGVSFFGKDPKEKNVLHIEFAMSGGSTQFINVDITDRLKDINTVELDVEIDVGIEILNQEAVLSEITIKARDQVNAGEGEVH
ncbi:DUF5119 domain-containing protein [uncultured Bacteroides sp.]|uniref:DUF5119 domain-containing protein n=1 Tax=uncultured Bacteroides sp. TaxID=162156 RepID=UPI002AAB083F|nr:DUF5119 domain-containing protein [uncultured Bacteroides sp.]